MFSDKQNAELAKPLNSAHVKPPAPGKYGEYIEGWRTIDEANRIFGFDGWTRETVLLTETNRELVEIPATDRKPAYSQWRVGYLAKVRVEAGGIVREGTGFGQGQGKPEALGDAIESAAKEAETDAMKRALMTFGNPFGLALYDKSKANVRDELSDEAVRMIDAIEGCQNLQTLYEWKALRQRDADASKDRSAIVAAFNAREATLKKDAA